MRLSFDDGAVGIVSLCRYSHRSLAAVTFMLLAVLSPPAVEGQTDMPRVENVAFTDRLSRYIPDDIIEVTVTFSEVVAVTGTPQIDLTIGSTDPPSRLSKRPALDRPGFPIHRSGRRRSPRDYD